MKRKSLLVAVGILVVALCLIAGLLMMLLRHEPEFYRAAVAPGGAVRRELANKFIQKFIAICGNGGQGQWGNSFTSDEINSFLSGDLDRKGIHLPEGCSEPRVAIEADKLRLGFRYGKKPWSTVISIDLHVWHKEPNMIALELERIRAGLLPISARSLLENISVAARHQNVEVNWYRRNRNPVAILRFQPDRMTPSVCLQRLELQPGKILICGRSVDEVSLPPAETVAASK